MAKLTMKSRNPVKNDNVFTIKHVIYKRRAKFYKIALFASVVVNIFQSIFLYILVSGN